jgi:heme exporter protein CcmB
VKAFLRVAFLVVKKDLTVEIRSLEILSTTLFFAATVVLVFSFGLVKEGRAPDDVAAAILWIAIAFSGALALGRTFDRERQNETLRALLLAPTDRPALYLGKLLGIVMLLCLVEALLVLMIGLLFQAPIFSNVLMLVALLLTGTVGFAGVGTLFAAMLVRARSRDVLLPIMLYPITIPVMIAGVRGTAALFQPEPDQAMAQFWLGLMFFFDVVFVTLALWTFEPLMTD